MAQDYMTTGTGSSTGTGASTGSSGTSSTTQNGTPFGQTGVGGAGPANRQMQDAMSQAQERFSQARDFVQQQATQYPMMTTAVALGAGLLIGMMMSGGGARR